MKARLHNNGMEVRVDLGNTGNNWPNCGEQHQPGFPWLTFGRAAWAAAEAWAKEHGATEIIYTGDGTLAAIRARVRRNQLNGRDPYHGLSSADIGRYNRALMFGDQDEAFPDRAEWARIVD